MVQYPSSDNLDLMVFLNFRKGKLFISSLYILIVKEKSNTFIVNIAFFNLLCPQTQLKRWLEWEELCLSM